MKSERTMLKNTSEPVEVFYELAVLIFQLTNISGRWVQKYYFLEQLDLPGENIYIFRTPHFAMKKHLIWQKPFPLGFMWQLTPIRWYHVECLNLPIVEDLASESFCCKDIAVRSSTPIQFNQNLDVYNNKVRLFIFAQFSPKSDLLRIYSVWDHPTYSRK